MSDVMRAVPFATLLKRMFEEYQVSGSLFGIGSSQFFRKKNSNRTLLFRESCDTPIGPAAGPHTQLAQNIAASYLTGGRFIELKTVQKLDNLDIEKPCIDARDEAYNTEWSTELSLEGAFDEYLKAWFVLHVLQHVFGPGLGHDGNRSFIFNMSIGYDLAGIQSPRVDRFVNSLSDASATTLFDRYRRELKLFITDTLLDKNREDSQKDPSLEYLPETIPGPICSSVTLSTMHGCPPNEIEEICTYLLQEKKLDTYVKLNPTLLGYDTARSILDRLGYDYIGLKRETFEHDLQFDDGIAMLRRLQDTAEENGSSFGVKLSNTLPVVNNQGELPGDEMYMSGRALYPLTINLAATISEEFGGKLPVSYAGGVNSMNITAIFRTGIRPITMATELLKPGGYLRLRDAADRLEEADGWERTTIDTALLTRTAEAALENEYVFKQWRGFDAVAVTETLPLFDCYTAPCMNACPIRQDVPDYLALLGDRKYDEALEVIYRKNPLPNITGHICDHQCMFNCTRLDYEGAVRIREMKRIAAAHVEAENRAAAHGHAGSFTAADYTHSVSFSSGRERPSVQSTTSTSAVINGKSGEASSQKRIAVIGAGPAGLSAAFFLARTGYKVTVFEKEESAGGIVRHILPQFRIPREAIERDVASIASHGVDFNFGVSSVPTVSQLREEGYDEIIIAIGAQLGRPLSLPEGTYLDSLDFLRDFHTSPDTVELGKHVAVIGGGNTAMDSARAATRVPKVESVSVFYRRTEKEMPADREEYENAINDGVIFRFLRNPEAFAEDGKVRFRVMQLGEQDESGRRKPVPTDATEEYGVDTVIAAIGETVDTDTLQQLGISEEQNHDHFSIIGDARVGPSTVVECIAEARKAADSIMEKDARSTKTLGSTAEVVRNDSYIDKLERHGIRMHDASNGASKSNGTFSQQIDAEQKDVHQIVERINSRKRLILPSEMAVDDSVVDDSVVEIEASRCLECDILCNKCVEVCPNRANIRIPVFNSVFSAKTDCSGSRRLFKDRFQIVHIDAYCNECGTCATFCPYEGKPYKDKLTLFHVKEDFEKSDNNGFILSKMGALGKPKSTENAQGTGKALSAQSNTNRQLRVEGHSPNNGQLAGLLRLHGRKISFSVAVEKPGEDARRVIVALSEDARDGKTKSGESQAQSSLKHETEKARCVLTSIINNLPKLCDPAEVMEKKHEEERSGN